MNRKLFLFFLMLLFLVGTVNFISAEKMWNFNNHTVNVSNNILSGGFVNASTDICTTNGVCLKTVNSTLGSNYVPYTGSNKNIVLGAYNLTADTNTLFIDSSSNRIGIGTLSPNELLEINSSMRFTNPNSGHTSRISIASMPSPAGGLSAAAGLVADYGAVNQSLILQNGYSGDMGGIKITDDGVAIWGAADEDLLRVIDEDDNAMRFRIDAKGNTYAIQNFSVDSSTFFVDSASNKVGIGTTSPTAKLTIQSSSLVSVPGLGNGGGQLAVLGNSAQYGLIGGVLGSGTVYLQAQRVDADPVAYNLLLQPNGGNVGIGTTNPSTTLHVNGTFSVTNTTGTQGLYQNAAGNVGIGITAPLSKLHISTPLAIAPATTPPTTAPFRISTPDKNTLLNAGISPDGSTSAWIQVQHASTAGSYYALNLNPMGGNVGIGTTSPTQKLDVNGTIQGANNLVLTGPDSTRSIYLYYGTGWPYYSSTITQTGAGEGIGGTRGLIINEQTGQTVSNYGIGFATNGTNRMFIQYTGNVGIGDITPSHKLDVAGNISSTGIGIFPQGITGAATGAPDAKIFSPSGQYLGASSYGINYNEGSPDYIEFVGGSVTSRIALDNGAADFGLGGGNFTVDSSSLFVDSSSNRVGIGTTSPSTKLDINGNLLVRNTGLSASFGGTSLNPAAAIANQTSYIQILGSTGGATNSEGLIFHNPGISTAALEYRNVDANTGNFIFKSDDTTLRLGVGKTPGETLDVAGDIKTSSNILQGTQIARPLVSWGVSGASTGAVIIKLPGTVANYGMINVEIDVYEYAAAAATKYICGGHNWNGQWYNYNCYTIGTSTKPVRLAIKDNQYAIVIGTNTSTWSYGNVALTKIINGEYYVNTIDLGGTYTIEQNSSAENFYTWISADLNKNTILTSGGTTNYIPKFTAASTLGNSLIYDNGTNIGIGTTSPSEKLTINNGKILMTNNYQIGWGNTAQDYVYGNNDTHFIQFVTNSTSRLRIDGAGNIIVQTGNVGIGTSSPLQKLDIVGNVLLEGENARLLLGNQGSTGDVHIGSSGMGTPPAGLQDYGFYAAHNAYRSSDGNWYHSRTSTIGAVRFTGGGGSTGTTGFRWDYSPNNGTNPISWSNLMTLTTTGKVGIGTTSPSAPLHIQSTTIDNDAPAIKFGYDSARVNTITGKFADGGANNRMIFNISTGTNTQASVMTLRGDGNVGIGTTSPNTLLEIASTTDEIDYLRLSDTSWNTDNTRKGITWNQGTTELVSIDAIRESAGNVGLRFSTYSSGVTKADVLTIQAGGNVGIGTTSPTSKLHIIDKAVPNAYYDSLANEIIEGSNGRFQLLANNDGTGGAGLVLTNSPASGNNTNWHINHVGKSLGDGLLFRYSNTNATGQDSYAASGFVNSLYLKENGNVGIGTTTPQNTLNVIGSGNVTGLFTFGSLPANSLNNTYFAANSVNARVIAASSINTTHIVDGTIAAADIGANVINSTHIATGAIINADILANAINTTQIIDGTILPADLNAAVNTSYDARYVNVAGDTMTGDLTSNSNFVSTARNKGVVGTYDSTKTDQIWSMGAAYTNNATGFNFGNLYGMAYCHTNNAACKAGLGHQVEFVNSGTVGTAIGFAGGIWTNGGITSASGNSSFDTSTLFIDSSANMVGILDSTPSYPLDVAGNVRTTGDFYVNGGDISITNNNGGIDFNDASAYWLKTATNWGLYWDTSANQIKFNGGGTTRASIDLDDGAGYFDGKVGIGTTSPTQKLTTKGIIFSSLSTTTEPTPPSGTGLYVFADINPRLVLARNADSLTNGVIDFGGNSSGNYVYANRIQGYAGNLHFYAQTPSTTDSMTTSKMTILSTGNVGIGTSSPTQKLDVNGSINIADGSALYYGETQAFRLADSKKSTLVGGEAGNISSTQQTVLGYYAGKNNKGDYQTAVGHYAGYNNSKYQQSVLGYSAGNSNSGSVQTAIGAFAGVFNKGDDQTALGSYAGYNNSNYDQTALGYYAGYNNIGALQTVVGSNAGQVNKGAQQTAIGAGSGALNLGNYQTAVGDHSGYNNTRDYQSAFGYYAGYQNRGNQQTVMGYNSGQYNSGDSQTAVGIYAGYNNLGGYQTALGSYAGSYTTGDYQIAIGYYTGQSNIGDYQTAVGTHAGYNNSNDYQSVFGYEAGTQNKGNQQSAFGYQAGYGNTANGESQSAFGSFAGNNNSGYQQTALGFFAGKNNNKNYQTAVGALAGYNNLGVYQTAIGYYAGNSNIGDSQTALGYLAGSYNTGNSQTAVGYYAGYNNTGNNVVAIGYEAGKDNTVANQFIVKQANINSVPLIQGNFSSGNVGIGTTTPQATLHVGGDVIIDLT